MKIPVFSKLMDSLGLIINPATAENQEKIIGDYSLRVDILGNIIYIGKAQTGTSTALPNWQIQKIDKTGVVTKLYCDGNANFDNIWDNRTSLTYL